MPESPEDTHNISMYICLFVLLLSIITIFIITISITIILTSSIDGIGTPDPNPRDLSNWSF